VIGPLQISEGQQADHPASAFDQTGNGLPLLNQPANASCGVRRQQNQGKIRLQCRADARATGATGAALLRIRSPAIRVSRPYQRSINQGTRPVAASAAGRSVS